MPWIVPMSKLGDQQRQVLDLILHGGDAHWIRGFAGSGKSVILIHALRESLARNHTASACVVVYTNALKDMLSTGLPDDLRDKVPVLTYHKFKHRPQKFDLIFVDEVQDLPQEVVQLLRSHCKRLIVAGDEEQSIYDNMISPDEILRQIEPRVHLLDIVYRLTERLKQVVMSILPGANIANARMGRLAAEVNVSLGRAVDTQTENAWVWMQAMRHAKVGEPSAILFPSKALIKQFIRHVCASQKVTFQPMFSGKDWDYGLVNDFLAKHNICLRYLGNNYGTLAEGDRRPIVYLLTYHSAKGLDFETVFLPCLTCDLNFWSDETFGRRLFFVATTRSRRNLFMTYSGDTAHKFVRELPSTLLEHITCSPPAAKTEADRDVLF